MTRLITELEVLLGVQDSCHSHFAGAAQEVHPRAADMRANRSAAAEIALPWSSRDFPVVKAVSQSVSPHPRSASSLVAFKATADVVSKGVTLAVTVAAARVLAPEAFGVLALAMTTGWILGVASDAGLPLYLARAVARRERPASALVREVMRLRGSFAIAALGAGLAVAAAWAPAGFVAAFGLIVAAQLAGAVLETLSHVYRGLGRSEIESTITIAQRLLAALLAAVALVAFPTLLMLSIALAIPPAIALVVSFTAATRLAGRDGNALIPASTLTFARFRREAAPIGLGVLISAIYFRCDVYFLNYWHGLDSVGMYNAVFRLVEALRLFPAAVLAVVFPELCRATNTRPLRRLALLMTAVGLLAMAFTITAAPGIVHVTFGPAYAPAAAALQVLALAVPLFFLNYALTHQVIAWEGQRWYLALTIAALATNVAGNVLLIPANGMLGAAWSTLVTELVVTAGCILALREKGRQPSALAIANDLAAVTDQIPVPLPKSEAP